MSRLASKPITVPEKTKVSFDGDTIVIEGPLGTLRRKMNKGVSALVTDAGILLSLLQNTKETRKLIGTYASHIKNMVEGVNSGFTKKLIIEGIGYKATLAGNTLTLNLGFSHPIKVSVPEGIKVSVDKETVSITGIDKERIGLFTASIRSFREPEPYKGKGIRYEGEVIRRKQGKKATASA